MSKTDYKTALEKIIKEVVAPAATEVDQTASFPRAALEALGEAGLLGLISAPEVGGLGQTHRAAAWVVEQLATACASTAMVVCMHYAGTAVIEAHGAPATRQAIAEGKHITTLAFSEAGSRSHFWAPLGLATKTDTGIRLDAKKSWVTSAGQADSYVWSSKPMAGDGASTIWLVPADAKGLQVPAPFDGLGLRGNFSSPITADGVVVSTDAMLGTDGSGFDVMMGITLPYFQMMSAAVCVGLMEAATSKTVQHITNTRFEHLNQTLADLPTIRAYLSRMRLKTDASRALLLDGLNALEQGREDAMLRVLEVKAAAGDTAAEVTELAMRVCGGAAFRKEVGVERNFRDARAAVVMAPTSDALYDFIGKALCGLPLFG